MYVPQQFAVEDLVSQHDLIDVCDFGIVVSNGVDGLFATHIPMMLKRDEGKLGALYGHVARPNPHVGLFGRPALVVFSGPHAYVSPTWYSDRSANVPTWNYAAVHCYGVPQPIEGDPIAHLEQMVERYEGARANGWSIDELKPQMRETLPRGIVAFRMEIVRIEGKAKLSQNKPRAERERVIAGLEAAGETELVELMRAALEKV
jgi:transcriptional regulator